LGKEKKKTTGKNVARKAVEATEQTSIKGCQEVGLCQCETGTGADGPREATLGCHREPQHENDIHKGAIRIVCLNARSLTRVRELKGITEKKATLWKKVKQYGGEMGQGEGNQKK